MRGSFTITVVMACVGLMNAMSADETRQTDADSGSRTGTHWLVFVDDLHVNFVDTGRLRTMLRETAADLIVPGDQVSIRATLSSGIADGMTEALAIRAAIGNLAGNALKPEDFLNAGSAPGGRALEEL